MRLKRMSVAVAAAAMTASALVSGASPAGATAGDSAGALACYDQQEFFSKPDGLVAPRDGYFVTSSACSDINVKLDTGAEVRVCFSRTGCQSSYKWAAANQWTVIATNVKDDVLYYLHFKVGFARTGYVAD